jgi:CPA2 family monovalent cation:H+ antiporter-2
VPFVVAEQNREVVERLREGGRYAVFGDGSEPMVLAQAHVARARVLVIATPDTARVRRMIEIARTLNLGIETVVRSHSEEEAVLLEREKAGKVFMGEHELALSMTRHVLERFANPMSEP